MKTYALIESGVVHTPDLDWESAQEMKNRHIRCFPDLHWEVIPQETAEAMPQGVSLMERQRRTAIRYNK